MSVGTMVGSETLLVEQPLLADPGFWPEPLAPGPLTVKDVLRGIDLDKVDPVALHIALKGNTGSFPALAPAEALTAADLAASPHTERARADSGAAAEAARQAQLQSRHDYVLFYSAPRLARRVASLTLRAVEAHNIADFDQAAVQRIRHSLGNQAVWGAQAQAEHSQHRADQLTLKAHRAQAKLNKKLAKQNSLRIVDYDQDAEAARVEAAAAQARLEKAEHTLAALFGGTNADGAGHELAGELHGVMLDTIEEVTAATEAAQQTEYTRETKVDGYSHGELHVIRQRKLQIFGKRIWTGKERLKPYKPHQGVHKVTTKLEVRHDRLYHEHGPDAVKLPDYAMYFFGTSSVEQTLPALNRPLARFTRPAWLRVPKWLTFGRGKQSAQEATA